MTYYVGGQPSSLWVLTDAGWLPVGDGPAEPTPVGFYQPGPATTGIQPGVNLTRWPASGTSDFTTTSDGQVIEGLDIYGIVKRQHDDVTVRNCRVRGGRAVTGKNNNVGLVDCNHPGLRTIVEYCELAPDPQWVSTGYTAVLGHDYTVRYCNVHYTVDAFGAYNVTDPTQDLEIELAGNWVHDLAQLSPDANHTDKVGGQPVGWTHNDAVQVQGCGQTMGKRQVSSHGNFYDLYASPRVESGGVSNFQTVWWPSAAGQCIGVTPNVSQIHDVTSDRDYFRGGAQSVTVILGSKGVGSGMAFTNGRYVKDSNPVINAGGVSARRSIRIDPTILGVDLDGNVYEDGSPVTAYRIT